MTKKIDKEKERKIIDLYQDGYGCVKIAEKLSINRITAQRYLKLNKIKLRKSRSPAHNYDIWFFNTFNRHSCYWAGFIAADGHIRNKGRNTLHIKLAQKDKGHLKIFLNHLKASYKVKHGEGYSFINISGEQIIKDLLCNFNITNNKSLTIEFPKNIPIEYTSDFIRGYFDGDGSVSRHSNGKILSISFIGTLDIINFIKHYFYYAIGIRLKSKNEVPPSCKINNIYLIGYSGKNAIKILNHLYNDSNNLRLRRKYRKFKEILDG